MVTAVSSNATVAQVGIKTEFTTGNQINSPLLPQSIYVIGQGNTNTAYTSEAVKIKRKWFRCRSYKQYNYHWYTNPDRRISSSN
jgi:hypothetical protein